MTPGPAPRTDAAFGYLRDAEGRLLLVANRYRERGILWGVPGGTIERGEEARACVEREFEEEVGLRVRVGRYLGTIERVKPAWRLNLLARFFEVELLGGTPRIDPEEEHVVAFRWLAAEGIQRWPEGVLGRAYLVDYLEDPASYPKTIVMAEDEE